VDAEFGVQVPESTVTPVPSVSTVTESPVTESTLTELPVEDLRLIQALQVVPRAPWSRIGAALGCDPVTAARRWWRLSEGGYAWVTAYRVPRRRLVVLIELACAPGTSLDVAARLAADPEVVTIDVTAGARDLVVTASFAGQDHLGDYLLHRLGAVPGLRDTTTHVLSRVVTDARSWRLRVLTADELAALEAIPRSVGRVRGTVEPAMFDAVLAELRWDGRARAVDLAQRLDIGVDRARAALNGMLAGGGVVVRAEVARRYSGRPTYTWFFLRAPARTMDAVLGRLAALRDVRLLATAVGAANIVMAMWLTGVDEIQRVESAIEQSLPDVTVVDRSLVLRTPKHLGRPLTAEGLSAER
jgi:DNA-binding Lrp family transcriptional regulator